jgi:hypothetical protein
MTLRARTNAEAHLYMDLHPCECGDAGFKRDSALYDTGEVLHTVYEGTCTSCGSPRRFEFEMPDELPRLERYGYGGDDPSTIIGADEFMAVSDQRARTVPASPAGLDAPSLTRARRDCDVALAAIEEVIKLIPDGSDRVDVDALRTAPGKQAYLRDPGRFGRLRLEAVRDAYRGVADKLAAKT